MIIIIIDNISSKVVGNRTDKMKNVIIFKIKVKVISYMRCNIPNIILPIVMN